MRLTAVLVLCFIAISVSFSSTNSTLDKELSLYEKLNIYNQQKYSSKDSIFYASFFGMGSGSFIQQDLLGGFIGMTGDLAGFALLGTGYYLNQNWQPGWVKESSNTYFILGALILLSSRIFQYVRPIIITDEKNKNLLMQLNLTIDF